MKLLNVETTTKSSSIITSISKPRFMGLPPKQVKGGRQPDWESTQGKLVMSILSMEKGQMIEIKYDGPSGNVSGRIGNFRKRYPTIKITTRKIDEDTLGIWRLS